jgi:YD repeat-containing protein
MNPLNNLYTKTIVATLGLILTTLSHAIDYTYDELHRLIKVTYASGQTIHYTYDAAGNILSALESTNSPPVTDDNPTATVKLNQSRYKNGDNFQFDIALNGQKTVDLYAAIILPEGYFITITKPQIISAANAIAPWQQNIGMNGQHSFRIFNYQIQSYLSRGTYTACGVLVSAQKTPLLDGSNWLHFECRKFELF